MTINSINGANTQIRQMGMNPATHLDLLKNHILELYEIQLLRFKTNGSKEKEKLKMVFHQLNNKKLAARLPLCE